MTPSQHAKVLEALERVGQGAAFQYMTHEGRECVDEALSIMRAVQVECDHIYTADSTGLNKPMNAVCMKCGYKPRFAPPTEHEVKP